MDTVQQLERRRNAVLEQMRAIRSLRHGTINEQYFPASVKGALAGGLRGPYYVLSRNEGGKTVSPASDGRVGRAGPDGRGGPSTVRQLVPGV